MAKLEWKKTTLGEVELEHWAKHDPKALLDSIFSRKFKRKVGLTPPVFVHAFGPHELAFRKFSTATEAKAFFSLLKEMAEHRHAVLEMPVALVVNPGRLIIDEEHLRKAWPSKSSNQVYGIATIWKKGTRDLDEYARDSSVPAKLRFKACKTAVEALARLNSAGYKHGHIKPGNFVVNKRGESALVDFTGLKQSVLSGKKNTEHHVFTLAGCLANYLTGRKPTDRSSAQNRTREMLLKHYDRKLEG